jgi:hypothetical protein
MTHWNSALRTRVYRVPKMALFQSQKERILICARVMMPMGMMLQMRPDAVGEMTQPRWLG